MDQSNTVPINGRSLKEDGTTYNIANFDEMTMGGAGLVVISDTALNTAKSGYSFVAIHCITDTVLSAYTTRSVAPITPTNALNGIVFPAGAVLYGQFATIQLSSGTAIAYYGVNN